MDYKAKSEELVTTHNQICEAEIKLNEDKLKVLGALGILQSIIKEQNEESATTPAETDE